MQHERLVGLAIAATGALALYACGGGGGSSSSVASPTAPTATAAPANSVTVAIVSSSGNSAYRPNPVSAKTGDLVMFRNTDTTEHHIVMDDGSADLGTIAPGATSQGMTLRSGAATGFHCTLHTSMVGSINGALPDTPPCNDPYGYGC